MAPPRSAVAALAVTALFATVPAALADNHVRLGGKITPVLRKFPKQPQPAALTVSLGFTGDNGEPASPLSRAIINFPYGAQLNGKLFPSCDVKKLEQNGKSACPKGSRIGGGHALGNAAGIREPIQVSLYNGKGGKSIVFYVEGDRPAVLHVPFEAPLKQFSSGPWNFQLTVNVPENLQHIDGLNADVWIEDFTVKVDGSRRVKGRKRGYIETLICPPGALVPVRGTFSFREAPDLVENSFLSCG